MDSLSSSVNLEPAWATSPSVKNLRAVVWCLSLAEHRPWDPQRHRPHTQARLHPRRPPWGPISRAPNGGCDLCPPHLLVLRAFKYLISSPFLHSFISKTRGRAQLSDYLALFLFIYFPF